jgi:hypothetical protein
MGSKKIQRLHLAGLNCQYIEDNKKRIFLSPIGGIMRDRKEMNDEN